MEDRYNLEYAQKMLKRAEMIGGERIFFKDMIVAGREHLSENQDRQRIYIANHIGHTDYMLLWLDFHRNGIQMPMIPAGKNLDNWFLKMVDIQLGKLGAYFVDRDLMKKDSISAVQHKKDTIKTTREIIKSGLDFLVFPEGGRNGENELFKGFDKRGNPIERYDEGTLRGALYNENDLDIVPLAFNYDHPVEEKFIPIIRKGNRKTLPGKILYYGADGFAYFLARPITKKLGFDVGNAYMSIGKPKPLSDLIELSAPRSDKVQVVKEFSKKEISNLYQEIEDRK